MKVDNLSDEQRIKFEVDYLKAIKAIVADPSAIPTHLFGVFREFFAAGVISTLDHDAYEEELAKCQSSESDLRTSSSKPT